MENNDKDDSCRVWRMLTVTFLICYLFNPASCMPVFRVAREPATKEGTWFYHINDGFYYHKSSTKYGVKYYKCVSSSCLGRAIFDTVDGFHHSQAHDQHGPNVHWADEMALRHRILQRCRSLEYTSYRQIIDQESHWFAPEVRSEITYERMRTPMRNARLQQYPPPPGNLRGLTRILMDPAHRVISMTDDGEDNIYAGSVTDEEGNHHILFVSRRMLARIRNDFNVIHSDGTFKCVPVGYDFASQIFAIVGVWQHHIVYLGWALMESRSEVAYIAVLRLLRQLTGPVVQFHTVISDFETAEQNAWQAVFRVACQGCLWHLVRAYMEEVVTLGMLHRMRNIPEVRRIIRWTLALPLLPENLIVRGYRLILTQAREAGMYIFRIVHPFLSYVWVYWVSRPWRRARMSCFQSEQRTNNVCESQNRSLRIAVGTHPNVYRFIGGLVTLEQRAQNMCLSLGGGRRPNQGRRRTAISNDRRIEQLSDDLIRPPGPIDNAIFNFLRRASHMLDNIVEEALLARRNQNN